MKNRRLHRNFMGYTTKPASDMLGLGVSAIGDVCGAFVQSEKKLSRYYQAIDAGEFPVHRGFELDDGRSLSAPPARPPRRIEFYGDSNLAGYSLESERNQGGDVAAPLFARVAEAALRHLAVPPDDADRVLRMLPYRADHLVAASFQPRPSSGETPWVGEPHRMPDLRGRSAREAALHAARRGLLVELRGSGRVIEQTPAPGVHDVEKFLQSGSSQSVRPSLSSSKKSSQSCSIARQTLEGAPMSTQEGGWPPVNGQSSSSTQLARHTPCSDRPMSAQTAPLGQSCAATLQNSEQ